MPSLEPCGLHGQQDALGDIAGYGLRGLRGLRGQHSGTAEQWDSGTVGSLGGRQVLGRYWAGTDECRLGMETTCPINQSFNQSIYFTRLQPWKAR